MKTGIPVALLVHLLLLSGCAGITVEGVGGSGQTADADAKGIRFYQEAPFLFVYPDGKGGIASEVKWLPDTTQVFSAKPYAILAKNESTLEFSASALTSADITVDETDVVKASVDALAKVLVAGLGANSGKQAEDAAVPLPKLYRIIVHGDTKEIGLTPADTVGPDGQSLEIRVKLPGG